MESSYNFLLAKANIMLDETNIKIYSCQAVQRLTAENIPFWKEFNKNIQNLGGLWYIPSGEAEGAVQYPSEGAVISKNFLVPCKY
jgi:hypothetical protein